MKSKINLGFDHIDFNEIGWSAYRNKANNPNNFSYWFNIINNKNSKFKSPKSIVIQFTNREYELIGKYYDNNDPKLLEKIKEAITFKLSIEDDFYKEGKLFIKNGTYSDKFTFKNCILDKFEINELTLKFLEINYNSQMKEVGGNTELVIREYIDYFAYDTIYDGMPLREEFRLFYDFDKKEIIGTVNYWDVDYMLRRGNFIGSDKQILLNNKSRLDQSFVENKKRLESYFLSNVDDKTRLEGKWSVDFMKLGDDFWLIDMALAHQSTYFNKVMDGGN